jgi:uncharacterized protein (TIGR02271 family)
MFDSQAQAESARMRLVTAGFASSAVSMIGGEPPSSTSGTTSTGEPHHEGAIARFLESIFGASADERADAERTGYVDTYNEAVRRGSFGVSVATADEDDMDRAERILNDCGAVDIDEKAESWRKEGWTGGASAKGSTKGDGSGLTAGAAQKLQEIEEELKIAKRAVARGGVRIFTRMTEVPVSETVRLREEHADVRRSAVDRPATEADFAAFKEGSIEVREMSEEAVVSKTARVTGEVEIGKTATEREETVRDTVRKTKVEVEQIDGGMSSAGEQAVAGSEAVSSGPTNRDPITGALGAHPVGTGVGAAAGGVAAGAAAGSVAGPVGTVVGAAAGAVAGGLAGKKVAEEVDPTTGKQRV